MKRILLAYDGDEPAKRALQQTIELATKFDAQVGVISVVPRKGGNLRPDPWDDRMVHAQELVEARSMLREHGIEVELYEPDGDVAPSIERVADEKGYDVIVVGTRNLGTMSKVLHGSVSEHVATHAHTTVIVAR
jgi:nucleotide-binding universal stress UspA family protein